MVTVQAQLETIPPDHTGNDPAREQRQVEAAAATYEEARDQIRGELAQGWRVMSVRTI